MSYRSIGPGQAQMYFQGHHQRRRRRCTRALCPASGLYLDEDPVTTVAGSLDIHMYDIARVEALAGPQGTLYGASSLSGTLRIITNKPDPSRFSAGYDVKADKYGKGDGGGTSKATSISRCPTRRRFAWWATTSMTAATSTITHPLTYQRASAAGVPDPITVNNYAVAKNNFNDIDTLWGPGGVQVQFRRHLVGFARGRVSELEHQGRLHLRSQGR